MIGAIIVTIIAACWAIAGIMLLFRERTPRVICERCGTRFEPRLDDARCPLCGEIDVPAEDDLEFARRVVGD